LTSEAGFKEFPKTSAKVCSLRILGNALPGIPFAMAMLSWIFIRRRIGDERYYNGYCKKIGPITLIPGALRAAFHHHRIRSDFFSFASLSTLFLLVFSAFFLV